MQLFKMCLNLENYQIKTSIYNYTSTYMDPTVSTNQKPTIDMQKLNRKEHKHKENDQTRREETTGRKEQRGMTKTTR